MNISVIGCGRWGSFIAFYLDSVGHTVSLCGRESSKALAQFRETRSNGLVTLPESVTLTSDLTSVLQAETVVISIDSQNLRSLCSQLALCGLKDKDIVLCMKGIEIGTDCRLSEIVAEELSSCRCAVWIGPGHVQEFMKGHPNCMVIDSKCRELTEKLIGAFSGPLIRFYYGDDLIGSEIGAAAKNVVGIAAGMLDGLGLSSLKGALMSRGTREVSRLIRRMGGNELSAYGLCHLGDYEATVFSEFSHNRRFGMALVKGETYTELAEGYYTAKALHELCRRMNVDMPICEAVYRVLYEKAPAPEALAALFSRTLKQEFLYY